MKKYLKMPWAVRRATLFAMIPALFLGGCGQQTKCEKSIDTGNRDLPDRLRDRKFPDCNERKNR